tara:strand:- start:49183 stop:49644 length:462 start_codon:yes stop_codon:yes gene_type:complete
LDFGKKYNQDINTTQKLNIAMDTQSFNLNAAFSGGFTRVFLKILIAITLVYVFVLILNFLRDKFLHNEANNKEPKITDLLSILNKLCYFSGFGFVLGNVLQIILLQLTGNSRNKASLNFVGEWDYLTFGIILIFIGIGFKIAKKEILKDTKDN